MTRQELVNSRSPNILNEKKYTAGLRKTRATNTQNQKPMSFGFFSIYVYGQHGNSKQIATIDLTKYTHSCHIHFLHIVTRGHATQVTNTPLLFFIRSNDIERGSSDD